MAFTKITYSGSTCNNYIYFAFYAEYFEVEKVTIGLGLKPTSVMIKKDPVPKSTSWAYKITVGNEIDLETPLEKLIEIFETKIDEINRLKKKFDLRTRIQFVIDIDIDPDASTPYFGLNNRTIDFLKKTETEVDFDVYKADTIGLLEG